MSVSRTILHKDGPSISRMVMGTWRLLDEPAMTSQQVLTLIKTCCEEGITTFDEADIYGDYGSEELFGKALSLDPAMRDKIEVITKCGIKLISGKKPDHKIKHYDTSKEHIIRSVENSLSLMGLEHIDVLLLHRPDPLMHPDEVAEAFHLLNEHGKVYHFGVSNFSVSQFELLQASCDMPLVTNQIEISLAHRDPLLDGTVDYLMQQGAAPMAWSPFGGGEIFKKNNSTERLHAKFDELSQKYENASYDQLTLAWLLSHPAKIVPILGTRKLDRIKAATQVEGIQLSRQDWFALWEAAGGQIP